MMIAFIAASAVQANTATLPRMQVQLCSKRHPLALVAERPRHVT